MTIPLNSFRAGRPDWTYASGMSGVAYQAPYPTNVINGQVSAPITVWPAAHMMIIVQTTVLDTYITAHWTYPNATILSTLNYAMMAPGAGIGMFSSPNPGPVMTLQVEFAGGGGASDDIGLTVITTDAGPYMVAPRSPLALVDQENTIAAGATLTGTAITAYDGDCDLLVWGNAASADWDVYTVDRTANRTYLSVGRAAVPPNQIFRARLLPGPLTMSIKNNDAVNRSFKLVAIPVF